MDLEDDVTQPVANESVGPDAAEPTVYFPFPEEMRPKTDHLIIQDDTPVDSTFFERLMRLLVEILYCSWPGPGGGRPFAAFANVGLFSQPKQTPFVPDFMLSLDVLLSTPSLRVVNSYFVWEFGKPPNLVMEFVSDRRGGEESHKMHAYARIGVAHYVVFDPEDRLGDGVLRAFVLHGGGYQPIDPRWLPMIGLGLALWEGEYQGHFNTYPRWCDRDGNLLLTAKERDEFERQRADRAEKRAEQLAAKLRTLGIDPDAVQAT